MSVECFYCGEPDCECGSRRFDAMAAALGEIAEYIVDERGETPREVMAHVRSIARRALMPARDAEPGDR